MPRPRLPAAKAAATGAAIRNPSRFKGRKSPKNTRPLGKPYAGMTAVEIRYWKEFDAELSWLNSGHRVLVRMACRLSAKMDEGEFGVSAAQALSSILSKLGATPVDETKVAQSGGEETDPGEEFFGRPN
ncbi:hypothetical protein LDO31_03020 [Luteimonas sp. XNQY3]|nr:hypothetical protein [Luteimonas sp. XNQY3]MCD9005219.1 hypothetical protein [Luteimonas sp. XNQY3]